MTARLVWILALSSIPAVGSAQAAELGLARRLDDPSGAPRDRADGEADEADDEEDDGPWPGPQIQMAYAYSKLADGYGGGDTHSAAFEVFVQWPLSQLRTSVLAAAGGRDYSLAGEDFVFRGALSVGFQLTELLDPFVPHIAVVGTAGAVVGERFETTVADGYGGAGVELGAALRIVRNLHVTATFSYLRLEMDGAAFDLFELRAGFGL